MNTMMDETESDEDYSNERKEDTKEVITDKTQFKEDISKNGKKEIWQGKQKERLGNIHANILFSTPQIRFVMCLSKNVFGHFEYIDTNGQDSI